MTQPSSVPEKYWKLDNLIIKSTVRGSFFDTSSLFYAHVEGMPSVFHDVYENGLNRIGVQLMVYNEQMDKYGPEWLHFYRGVDGQVTCVPKTCWCWFFYAQNCNSWFSGIRVAKIVIIRNQTYKGKIYDLNANYQKFISLLIWSESISLFARIIFSYFLCYPYSHSKNQCFIWREKCCTSY